MAQLETEGIASVWVGDAAKDFAQTLPSTTDVSLLGRSAMSLDITSTSVDVYGWSESSEDFTGLDIRDQVAALPASSEFVAGTVIPASTTTAIEELALISPEVGDIFYDLGLYPSDIGTLLGSETIISGEVSAAIGANDPSLARLAFTTTSDDVAAQESIWTRIGYTLGAGSALEFASEGDRSVAAYGFGYADEVLNATDTLGERGALREVANLDDPVLAVFFVDMVPLAEQAAAMGQPSGDLEAIGAIGGSTNLDGDHLTFKYTLKLR